MSEALQFRPGLPSQRGVIAIAADQGRPVALEWCREIARGKAEGLALRLHLAAAALARRCLDADEPEQPAGAVADELGIAGFSARRRSRAPMW
jgi:hypothetical protein